MLGRRSKISALVMTATLCLAVPTSAPGATTIGETFAPNQLCSPDSTLIQSSSPGNQYAAPSSGVITSWSQLAGPTAPNLKFKVVRLLGGSNFSLVGEGPSTPITASTLNTFPVRIPVQSGDIIGFYLSADAACASSTGVPGHVLSYVTGDVPSGATFYPNAVPNFKLDLSANLEPDADGDGFGDETQDQCSTQAITPGPCENGFSFGKLKRATRKGTATLTVEVPGPGTLALTGKGLVKQRPDGAPGAVRAAAKTVSAVGEVTLKVRSKGKKKRKLIETGEVKLKAKVTYTPTGGTPNTEVKRIKLVKRP